MRKHRYTEREIDSEITRLSTAFESACEQYKLVLANRESNRSKKEIIRDNARGTNLHKFQCNFAWILHDLKCGPICFVEDNINEAEELISHVRNIKNQ